MLMITIGIKDNYIIIDYIQYELCSHDLLLSAIQKKNITSSRDSFVIWIKNEDGIVGVVDCLVVEDVLFDESVTTLSPHPAPLIVLYRESKPSKISLICSQWPSMHGHVIFHYCRELCDYATGEVNPPKSI